MAAAELRLVEAGLGLGFDDGIERVVDGRSQILRFATGADPDTVAAVIGQLSASTALFRRQATAEGSAEALTAITIEEHLRHDSELATVQRYRGKTNERLTRAMLNIALATAGIDPSRPKGSVLDPMCGRGTTLNWALAYGMDAVGIDVEAGSVDQHATFLQTWAKRQRLPHRHQVYRKGNAERRLMTMEVASDRASLKAGRAQSVATFVADGGDRSLPIKRDSIDVIVSDLPYGVQHRGEASGAAGPAGETGPLLERILPTWRRWLRPGGAACVAWNLKRASRDDVARLMVANGLKPVTVSGGHSMRHAVDATIDRDVLVAVAT